MICNNNNFISFLSFVKTKIIEFSGISDIYYENIPKSKNEIYPIIVYNIVNSNLVNEQKKLYNIEIKIYDNDFEDILNLEQITQNIFNGFNYYTQLVEFNNDVFLTNVTELNQFNLPVKEDDIRSRLIDLFIEVEFQNN